MARKPSAVAPVFRFDAHEHTYTIDGVRIPSVTQLLERAGLVDTTWFTEDSRERGTRVHELCTAYDLGALRLSDVPDLYLGWVKAYAAAKCAIRPVYLAIEEPEVSIKHRIGCRPDRIRTLDGVIGLTELKTGAKMGYHGFQLALQAIVVGERMNLPAERFDREAIYLKDNGRFTVERFPNPSDIIQARQIIERWAK